MTRGYVLQLLPDLAQARLLYRGLTTLIERGDLTDDETDAAWELIATIARKIREN